MTDIFFHLLWVAVALAKAPFLLFTTLLGKQGSKCIVQVAELTTLI
jgi:hypothetical protein